VDRAGNHGVAHAQVFLDTTPPVLILPSSLVVDATGPAGATVTFSASATDNFDPAPTVTCAPPSGSVFPIGNTTVTCTANHPRPCRAPRPHTNPWVPASPGPPRGADEPLAAGGGAVQGAGLPRGTTTSLLAKRERPDPCSSLVPFTNELNAQSGKHFPASLA